MLRNRERDDRAGPGHHHMATLTSSGSPAGTLKPADCLRSRDKGQPRQATPLDGYFDDLDVLDRGPRGAAILLHLEPALDRLADVGEGLLPRASLACAARESGALGDDVPVLARVDEHLDRHSPGMLALATALPKRLFRPDQDRDVRRGLSNRDLGRSRNDATEDDRNRRHRRSPRSAEPGRSRVVAGGRSAVSRRRLLRDQRVAGLDAPPAPRSSSCTRSAHEPERGAASSEGVLA